MLHSIFQFLNTEYIYVQMMSTLTVPTYTMWFDGQPVRMGGIGGVATLPQYRRRGAAGKLLDVFLRFARANHLAFLTLEVRPSNAAAIALYTRFGFREAGRRRNYYDLPREGALILTRTFGEERR